MNIIRYPERSDWKKIAERPHTDTQSLTATVYKVLEDIRVNGDNAVTEYEAMFDHARLESLAVTEEEIDKACNDIDNELAEAISIAHGNILKFHESQQYITKRVETCNGVECWQKSVAIEKVGLYIPGGTAPLFSTVLMLATPAKIAGCKDIILCTPPSPDGSINPAILAAARTAGVSRIFKIGGIQAIGAMAYGTESVPKVFKIFGPGNRFVMTAKQQVSLKDVAIDMPAGPSEVCIIADDTCNIQFVAADLLSQAEHGKDSQVLLITTSETVMKNVTKELECQLEQLPRKEIAAEALNNSTVVLVKTTEEAIEISNIYAPEHLIISTSDYMELADKVVNAGSVFLGKYACESAGDYASGTNHTLPTHGYAKAYSGVNLDSYCRKITFQHITEEGIRSIGRAVETMARHEQLEAHRNAMTVRIKSIDK